MEGPTSFTPEQNAQIFELPLQKASKAEKDSVEAKAKLERECP